jgi:hypothetical protein
MQRNEGLMLKKMLKIIKNRTNGEKYDCSERDFRKEFPHMGNALNIAKRKGYIDVGEGLILLTDRGIEYIKFPLTQFGMWLSIIIGAVTLIICILTYINSYPRP